MNNEIVNFIQMVNLVSPEYSAYFDKYKLYAEISEFGNIEIRIQYEDEDMYLSDFFSEIDYLTDWINHQFIIKKNGMWVKCDFKKANSCYESGMTVRCEVNGVVEEFNKTSRELRSLPCVVSMNQLVAEWEYFA